MPGRGAPRYAIWLTRVNIRCHRSRVSYRHGPLLGDKLPGRLRKLAPFDRFYQCG